MRGLDTNVLVRILTADDPVQSPKAITALGDAAAAGETFHISIVVLCELVWTLRSRPFGFGREELVDVVEKLLGTALFQIQERTIVRQALEAFRVGRADFSDYLLGRFDARSGCTDTLTFDRRLAQHEGYTLIE